MTLCSTLSQRTNRHPFERRRPLLRADRAIVGTVHVVQRFNTVASDIEIALAWPNDTGLAGMFDDRSWAILTTPDWDAATVVTDLATECITPVWTISDVNCDDLAHTSCRCALVGLADVVTLLEPAERCRAAAAQAAVVASLSTHVANARSITTTAPNVLPDGEVCPACLFAEADHVSILEEELQMAAEDLAAALQVMATSTWN